MEYVSFVAYTQLHPTQKFLPPTQPPEKGNGCGELGIIHQPFTPLSQLGNSLDSAWFCFYTKYRLSLSK